MSADESTAGGAQTLEDIERRIDEKLGITYDTPLLSKSALELAVYLFAAVFFFYHMFYSWTGRIPRSQHGVAHLALVLFVWGLLHALQVDTDGLRGHAEKAGALAYSVLAAIPLGYMYVYYNDLIRRAGAYTDADFYMGVLLIALVLVALWTISRLITGIAVLGIVYSYYGQLMPAILNHRGLTPNRIVTMNSVEFQGILGRLLQISATWVVIFLLLAGLMEKYGGMSTFIKGVTKLSVRSKHVEIGQVAVAASAFMGSINGSTAANTATTGAFTIPLMKENGYSPNFAAAIESVASCGGQVLPPIMGAGAFLMAELLTEQTYSDIIVAAVAPAMLFFLTVAISISLNSQRSGVQTAVSERESNTTLGAYVRGVARQYEYLGMFAVLLYYLVYIKADPMFAGFWSILTLVVLRNVRHVLTVATDEDAEAWDTASTAVRETLEGFRRGMEATINITILLASLGIVIRALIVTGFAQQLSTQLVIMADGSLPTLLVLAMVASIVFGMGMSTTAAYMIVAILVAPSLTQIGMNPLIAHFFVFYFAIVSNITPPIALSVVIAQGIADSSYLGTAMDALKIGFPMFLLPYAFVFNRDLLEVGPMTVVAFVIVLAGFLALTVGIAGTITERVNPVVRLGFAATGITAILAPWFAVQLAATLLVAAGVVHNIGQFPGSRVRTAE